MIQWLHAEKEEAKEVQRDERGESGVEGGAGRAQASKAPGEQEARQESQTQTQSGEAAG
jgi:hypothetical protein